MVVLQFIKTLLGKKFTRVKKPKGREREKKRRGKKKGGGKGGRLNKGNTFHRLKKEEISTITKSDDGTGESGSKRDGITGRIK